MKSAYIMFSKTASYTGKLIRVVTGNKFNHISLCIDDNFETLYSFARHFNKAPFYGGLVEESPLRYAGASVKIAKVELTNEQYSLLESELNNALENKNDYIYNFLSAAVFPFHRRIEVNNAYTCVEFVVYMLSRCKTKGVENKYYSIVDMEKLFEKNIVFEGVMPTPENANWGNDKFNFKPSYMRSAKLTAVNFARLAGRYYNGRKKNN